MEQIQEDLNLSEENESGTTDAVLEEDKSLPAIEEATDDTPNPSTVSIPSDRAEDIISGDKEVTDVLKEAEESKSENTNEIEELMLLTKDDSELQEKTSAEKQIEIEEPSEEKEESTDGANMTKAEENPPDESLENPQSLDDESKMDVDQKIPDSEEVSGEQEPSNVPDKVENPESTSDEVPLESDVLPKTGGASIGDEAESTGAIIEPENTALSVRSEGVAPSSADEDLVSKSIEAEAKPASEEPATGVTTGDGEASASREAGNEDISAKTVPTDDDHQDFGVLAQPGPSGLSTGNLQPEEKPDVIKVIPATSLPSLIDPEPSTTSTQAEQLSDASALLQDVQASEAEGISKPEQMDVDDAPKVLASMPSLAPITDSTPIIYATESLKKDEPSTTLQSGISKEATQKILKEILPESEAQQLLNISQQTPSQPTIYVQGQPSAAVLTPIKQFEQAVSQLQKKEPSETDDLATLANAALGDQAANGVKAAEEPSKKEPVWCDVGILKSTSCHVVSYYEPSFNHDQEHENISVDNLPDYANSFKIDLEPGTAYKFRVCAINSCGRGPWSEVSAFKTCLPGYPGAPSSIKISKSTEGAHLSWEPPSNPAGNIIEYSVCLAVRNPPQGHGDQKGQQLAFVRVYSGPHNQTVVPNSSLAAAHIDTTSKPAIIFRIAAKNEKGFGPATQVRWLQDVVASPTGGMKPVMKKDPIASGIPIKRAKIEDY